MRAFFKNKSDLGKLMMLIGFLMLVPITVIPFYAAEHNYVLAFLIPSLVSIILGFTVCCLLKTKTAEEGYVYTIKRGSLTVLFAWLYAIVAGAIPFLYLGELSFIQCLFESASGWTTTGYTVINVTAVPHVYLFHRSFMQFCGGLGFILMMVMIISNKNSMNLYNFEGHSDHLTPSVIRTARTIFRLYSAIFLAGSVLYIICGMPVFDSIVHCMSALSTGGFSTRAGSIGEYNSILIEAVTILIMLAGMTNFAVLLFIARKKFKRAARMSEIRLLAIILATVIPLVAASLYLGLIATLGDSIRHSIFGVVSVLSTTGFTTLDFAVFPPFALGLITILMFVGGGSGSTSGGIKLHRTYLLLRGAEISVRKKLSPEGSIYVPHFYRAQGKSVLDNSLLRDAYAYTFIYFLIFIATALLLCLTESVSLPDAMFAAASLSGTVGVSIGIFGPSASAATLVIGIAGMIIARLEINIVLIGICSVFVRRFKRIT